jgi:hypothetical protein
LISNITVDATEPPEIDLLQAPLPWEQVQNHVGIAHRPVLAPQPDSDQYKGVYWNNQTRSVEVTGDLGSDQGQAAGGFRAFLREPPAGA